MKAIRSARQSGSGLDADKNIEKGKSIEKGEKRKKDKAKYDSDVNQPSFAADRKDNPGCSAASAAAKWSADKEEQAMEEKVFELRRARSLWEKSWKRTP
jgi:hypothetical protein